MPLTLKQIEDFFRTLTCQILGLNPDDPLNADKVRISWQTNNAPAWKVTDDVIFIQVRPLDTPYIRQRETTYEANNVDTANKVTSYTRAHTVDWILYGPNSYDNAENIRNGLFDAFTALSANNLFLILDVPAPVRVPDSFNGRWWERSDLIAHFYENVTRQTTIPYIKGTNIQIMTEEGVVTNANSSN